MNLVMLRKLLPSASPAPPEMPGRVPALDGLRGIAALAVVLFHFTGKQVFPEMGAPLALGRNGVELFFIISGFVILMTVERRASLTAFAQARFTRLFPAFWLSILLIWVFSLAFVQHSAPPGPGCVAVNFTMMPRMFGCGMVESVYWTLEIELYFYALVAVTLALGVVHRIVTWMTLLVLVGLVVEAYGLREVVRDLQWPLPQLLSRLMFFFLLDGKAYLFLTGIVFYRLYARREWASLSVLPLCLAAAALDPRLPLPLYGLFLGVFLLVAFRPAFSLLSSPPLLFLGAISYSLYLLHMTIGRAIADEVYATTGSVALSLGAAVAAVVALATLVTYGFERPSQRHLRARLRLNRPNRGGDSLSPRSRPAEARSGS